MSGITAVIITKNEEKQIRRCLDSIKDWVQEIIIVDDCSSDQTGKIVTQEYKARLIVQASGNSLASLRNLGIDAASQTWIFQMDADEVIPLKTAQAIQEAVRQDKFIAFNAVRQDCINGQPLKYVGRSDQLKLFKKSDVRYSGMIHEHLPIQGPVGNIVEPVMHHPIASVSAIITRHNFYTDVEALQYIKKNPHLDIKKIKKQLVWKPFKLFFKHYVKNSGYKDGVPGLIWCMIHTIHPVMFWLKVLEHLHLQQL